RPQASSHAKLRQLSRPGDFTQNPLPGFVVLVEPAPLSWQYDPSMATERWTSDSLRSESRAVREIAAELRKESHELAAYSAELHGILSRLQEVVAAQNLLQPANRLIAVPDSPMRRSQLLQSGVYTQNDSFRFQNSWH